MKTIAIDAIDIKSFGGLVHLQQLIKKLSRKNVYIKIFSNSFVENKLTFKNNKKIKIIKNSLFDRNFILRHLWKIFFFEKELNKKNCKLLLSLNGIYHGFYNPTILVQQNILPFDDYAKSKYNFLFNLKFFFQKLAILLSIKIHKHVIFTSFDTRKRILKYFKSKNLLNTNVIYHGASNKSVKNKFFFKKKLKLLFVSEFQKYKNHENLFHAIKKDKKRLINLTCIGKYEVSDLKKLNTKYNFKKINIKVLSTISPNSSFS